MKTLLLPLALILVAGRVAPAHAAADDWAQPDAVSRLRETFKSLPTIGAPRPPADIPEPRFTVVHVMVPYDNSIGADKAKQAIQRGSGVEQLLQLCKGKLDNLAVQLIGEPLEMTDTGGNLHLVQLCKEPGGTDQIYVLLQGKDTHYLFSQNDAEKSAKQQLTSSCAALAPDAELVPGYVRVDGPVYTYGVQACRYKKPY